MLGSIGICRIDKLAFTTIVKRAKPAFAHLQRIGALFRDPSIAAMGILRDVPKARTCINLRLNQS